MTCGFCKATACVCLSALSLVVLVSGTSQAVTIDKELLELISSKDLDLDYPVLMIFDEHIRIDDDLIAELSTLDPKKKSKKVIALLKKKSKKVKLRAMSILVAEDGQPRVNNLTDLYFANAIAFEGSDEIINELATLDDPATLYYNKSYALKTAVSLRQVRETAGTHTCRADTAWSTKYVGADDVWRDFGYTGNGVIIGHIDSGVHLDHTDLNARLWTNQEEIPGNGIDDDGNGFVDDIHGWDFGDVDDVPADDSADAGHGTHTAGTAVGDGSGGICTGVAPGAQLMVCKAVDNTGMSTLSMIWEAEQYCIENGARIITLSMGVPGEIPTNHLRNDRLNTSNIRDAGVIVFNAAGNQHELLDPPFECSLTARCPSPWVGSGVAHENTGGVVTIGGSAYKSDDILAESSQGPVSWGEIGPWYDAPYAPGPGLIKPDLTAPGGRINSLCIPSGYTGDTWSGTSMACPLVAGVAALMLEKNPSLSPVGIDSLLQLTAADLGEPGKDNVFGAGMVDAYAAVQATPELQLPFLIVGELLPDFDGDGVLDPGQSSKLACQIINNSGCVDAREVEAYLAVLPNDYVSVADGDATLGDVLHDGGQAMNLTSPFTLVVAPDAPDGYPFYLQLTLIDSRGFSRTYTLDWYVGQPLWRTHDAGAVFLTVTGQGILGFTSMQTLDGDGMGYGDKVSDLYLGSFWGGTDADYVCNRDYEGTGDETHEWVTRTEPSGRVRDISFGQDDEVYAAAFTDAGHAEPRGVVVEQRSFGYSTPQCGEFVVLEYTLSNTGDVDMPSYHTGVFCDYDVGDDASTNEGGTDPSRNLAYIYNGDGPYYGVALLGSAPAQNQTLINNPQYVYTDFQISDRDKIDHLNGSLTLAETPKPEDWSLLVSRTVDLSLGSEPRTVAYALVYGETLADLQNNVDVANEVYDPATGVEDEVLPGRVVRLAQNQPNPFNPCTAIRFTLPRDGRVDLAVYDLSGRRVRSLVAAELLAGDHQVSWNGVDDTGAMASSGLYFYKLQADGVSVTRKMTLLK